MVNAVIFLVSAVVIVYGAYWMGKKDGYSDGIHDGWMNCWKENFREWGGRG